MKKSLLLLAIALLWVFVSCSDEKDEPVPPDNGEYVDLGLPSGTLWATRNVGADNPEDSGDCFAWGETAPKDNYNWKTYKWVDWECDTITEYYFEVTETWHKYYDHNWTTNIAGDCKTELDPEDDAACVNWGAMWRMPSLEQFQELVEKCNWLWTKRNKVNGYLVTGPNGNSIFLPAAGGYSSQRFNYGKCGYFWTRTRYSRDILALEAADQGEAYILYMNYWGEKHVWYDSRYDGLAVRPVRAARKE